MKKTTEAILELMIDSLTKSLSKNRELYVEINQLVTETKNFLQASKRSGSIQYTGDHILHKIEQLGNAVNGLEKGEFRKEYAVSSLKRILSKIKQYKERTGK